LVDSKRVIWVSGTRGFIGSYLVRSLISEGYQVRCVSNSNTNNSKIIYFDFSDRDRITAAVDKYGIPDIFIHLGWGDVYKPQSVEHITTNLQNGKNLIDKLYQQGLKKFVLIGSSSEYGDREGILSEELSPQGNLNNYIRGKRELSQYGLASAEKHNRIFIHVRLFYTFGAGQKHNSLINQLYKSHLERKPIELSPCEHYRDYIHISDCAEGITRISNVSQSEIINLGSGKVIKLKKFIIYFWKQLGSDPTMLHFDAHCKPDHEPTQPYCYADLKKLKALTNWSPQLSIYDGIKQTVKDLSVSLEKASTNFV
jgi:nucleoside-diphosphate-sugar epimerase